MTFPQLQQVFDRAAERYGFAAARPTGQVVAAQKDAAGWTLFARDFSLCVDADLHHTLLIRHLPSTPVSGSVQP